MRSVAIALLLLGVGFATGLNVGRVATLDALATVCRPQPGEKLVSTEQNREGVICRYLARSNYGSAIERRAAQLVSPR